MLAKTGQGKFYCEPDKLTINEQCIQMKKVCYQVGGRTILSDFDLLLKQGINRTILGVSGSGKTTILRLLLGLIQPQSGQILINGMEITNKSESEYREQRKKIAIVFQGGALFDSMTVGENVGYRLFEEGRLTQQEIEQIVREKLRFVGVEPALDLYPAELSGGMKKRVAIARALAADPEYIFFDEPTTGLDPIGVYNIASLVKRLQQDGKTTLMVTHDLPTAFATSQRFTMLHESRLGFEGTGEELKASQLPFVQQFLNPDESALFVQEAQ